MIEEKEKFIELVNMYDDVDKNSLIQAYDNISEVITYFEENFHLNVEETNTLSEKFTENYLKNNPEFILQYEESEDVIGMICKLYHLFLESKGYTKDHTEDLTLITNFIFKICEKNI